MLEIIDETGKKYILKCPDCPKPFWLWRDLFAGCLVALVLGAFIFG